MSPALFQIPPEEGFRELLIADADWREQPINLALVAELDDQVVGYLEASIQEPGAAARWQWASDSDRRKVSIGFVATDSALQRVGIASPLVKAAEDWGREHGAEVAVTETWMESPFSVPFWERKMGYVRRNITLRKPLI